MEVNLIRDKSRLYYEGHITLEQGAVMAEETENKLTLICEAFDLRKSTFLLIKPDDPEPQAFISLRDPSYAEMCHRIKNAIHSLECAGFKVRRWKIEDTVLDSNKGDTIDLLSSTPAQLAASQPSQYKVWSPNG